MADHILGPAARLHPHLVYDLHDRCSYIDLKRAIKRNNGALKQAAPTMELLPSDQESLATTYEIKNNPYAPKVSHSDLALLSLTNFCFRMCRRSRRR